ncbi:MAG TPA: hypothetical protein VF198_03785 [Vicinamibacterales bacterium]
MQVQRFRKPTVREALAEARETLGPDALVLSTLMVPMRGWRRITGRREVEVTAARAARLSESRPEETPVTTPVAPVVDRAERTGGDTVVARLVAAGVDRGLATEVAAALPPASRRDPSARVIAETLARRLEPLVAGPEPAAPVEVFVGPPGAGKTTTIAKIAAQARARGHARPTLVAADGYRVGAVEQLRLYAEILGLPFVVARTALDLERAVGTAGRPMLVDTAGRSPADRGIRDLFDALSGRPGVRTHLVLPAGLSTRDAERVLDRYAPAAFRRVVLSKVDETESAAAVIAVLRARALPVSWIGCGQMVPEDLRRATGRLLAAAVLGEPVTADSHPAEVPCA